MLSSKSSCSGKLTVLVQESYVVQQRLLFRKVNCLGSGELCCPKALVQESELGIALVHASFIWL